jgi:hypothetical protein
MGSKWKLETLAGGEWIELAQDRDEWRALVNTVMNLGLWRHLVNKLDERRAQKHICLHWPQTFRFKGKDCRG